MTGGGLGRGDGTALGIIEGLGKGDGSPGDGLLTGLIMPFGPLSGLPGMPNGLGESAPP